MAHGSGQSLNHCTIETRTYASVDFAAHFHVPVGSWNDRDNIVPKEQVLWQFVRKKSEGRKLRTEQFNCMRCWKRSKHAKNLGTCGDFKWMGKFFFTTICGSGIWEDVGFVSKMFWLHQSEAGKKTVD